MLNALTDINDIRPVFVHRGCCTRSDRHVQGGSLGTRSACSQRHRRTSYAILVADHRRQIVHLSNVVPGHPWQSPIILIASTCRRRYNGSGQGILEAWILFRFRISFSAHTLTIARLLLLLYPCLNRNSPATYFSRSLKTMMLVL